MESVLCGKLGKTSTHTHAEREGEFLKYTVDSYLNSHVALFTTLGISTIVQGR